MNSFVLAQMLQPWIHFKLSQSLSVRKITLSMEGQNAPYFRSYTNEHQISMTRLNKYNEERKICVDKSVANFNIIAINLLGGKQSQTHVLTIVIN